MKTHNEEENALIQVAEGAALPSLVDGNGPPMPKDCSPPPPVNGAPSPVPFLDKGGQAYVQEFIGQRVDTMLVGSRAHKRRLAQAIARARKKSARRDELEAMIAEVEAAAQTSGVIRSTWHRVAEENGNYYLDLCTLAGDVVEVTPAGWRVVQNPDVHFLRPAGAMPLPIPVRGGKLQDLRKFLNVSDEDFPLVVAFMLQALRPTGPYPVLALFGEQGSAKSTTTRVLRKLIDPAQPELRLLPRSERDLFIAAANSWLLPFDNLSGISWKMSDTLCVMSTSGAFGTRKLYADGEEFVVEACRPVILNGIEELVTRSDLLSRTLLVSLPTIDPRNRQLESEFWAAFEAERPRLLGALLDALVVGLAGVGNVKLPRKPRLADFATWAAACAPSIGVSVEEILAALEGQEQEARSLAFDADVVAQAVQRLMQDTPRWFGPATELLETLRTCLSEPMARQLPANAAALTNRLKRSAGVLRGMGIDFRSVRVGHGGSRRIELMVVEPEQAPDKQDAPDQAPPPATPVDGNGPQIGEACQPVAPSDLRPPGPQDLSWLR